MTKTIRILTLLALMVIGAGQAWAETVELGKIIYTQGDNDGGALEFYEDLACNNKITLTNGKSSALSVGTVYIKATPEFGYAFDIADEGSKVTFITAEVTAGTGAAGARTRSIAVGDFIDVTATATKDVYKITMPADEKLNVTVTATFPAKGYQTGVSYIQADGTETTTHDGVKVWVLDGTEGEELGQSDSETWYICNSSMAYDHRLKTLGDVNIIMSGSLTIGTAESPISKEGIYAENNLCLYGQASATGTNNVTINSNWQSIKSSSGAITITNCSLDLISTTNEGINAKNGVTITGCAAGTNSVKVNSNWQSIYSSSGAVSITNCSLDLISTTNEGINVKNGVTITGCAAGTNSVKVNSNMQSIKSSSGAITITNCSLNLISTNNEGIEAKKSVTITGCAAGTNSVKVNSNMQSIKSSSGAITITNCSLDLISTSNEGIYASGDEKDITITGCAAGTNSVKVNSKMQSIYSIYGAITITNCSLNLISTNNEGIEAKKSVTITGCAAGTNNVKVNSNRQSIYSIFGAVSITNCSLDLTSSYNGIYANNDVTITGCTEGTNSVKVNSNRSSIYSNSGAVSITNCSAVDVEVTGTGWNGIQASTDLTITGGQVTVTLPESSSSYGLNSYGNIILGWINSTDFIQASSICCSNAEGSIQFAEGKRFYAYNGTEIEAVYDANMLPTKTNGIYSGLAGRKLTPCTDIFVKLADGVMGVTVSATGGENVTIGTNTWYKVAKDAEVTLSYGGTDFVTVGGLPEGTTLDAVENQPLQRSFAMPAQDVALTATAVTGLTASGTYTYTGSPQTPDINLGESAFEATNYSVTGITPKEGSNSELTDGKAVDVGEYSLAITGLGQYIGPASVDFTIGKADYDGTTTALGYVCYGQVTADAKLTLPDLPDGASYAATGNVGGDSPALIDGAPTVSGTTLTYNTTSQDEGTSATITIGVTGAKNYNDYDVVVTVKANINIIENDNGTVVTKIGDDTYNVSIDEGDGSGGVIVIPGGGNSIDVADLDYSRTLTAPTESNKDAIIGGNVAKLYTTCQPTVPATNANVKYFTLTSVSDNTLNFEEVTSPVADKPYLMAVIGNSNIPEQVTGSNVTLKKIVTGTPVDGYTMMGTQTGLSNADAISAANGSNVTYILQAQSTWGKVTNKAGVYIPPFRAFIVGPAVNTGNAARQLNSSFDDDDATGIDSIRTIDSDGTERWYDLNGRRIDKPTRKGIYIRNGKMTTTNYTN